MRRNLIYLLCASALIALGGCEKGISVEDNNENPSNVTPDANGMVTYNLSVGTAGYGDGMPTTRTDASAMSFTQVLDDEYAITTTLEASPMTRATSGALENGSTVFIVACNTSNVPVGYQKATVQNGNMALVLPVGTYNLVLISYSDQTDFNPGDYVSGTPGTTTSGYTPLTGGAFLTQGTSAVPSDANGILADYVVSYLPNIAITASSTAAPPTAQFKHAFSELQWTLVVDTLVTLDDNDAKQRLGTFGAGFSYKSKAESIYPKMGNIPDAYAALSSPFYSGTKDEETPVVFSYTYVANKATSMYRDTIRFAPDINNPVQSRIYLNNITIEDPLFDSRVIPIPASGIISLPIGYGNPMSPLIFKPGYRYKVTSTVTKKVTWALSNIYWDSDLGTLVFATRDGGTDNIPNTVVANTSSPYYQGIFFKWGSLVGFAPIDNGGVYTPASDGATYNGYNSYETDPSIVASVSEYLEPIDLEPSANAILQNGKYWYGDICAYLTNGVWRMPNSKISDPIVPYKPRETKPWRESTSLWGFWINNSGTAWGSQSINNIDGKGVLDPMSVGYVNTPWHNDTNAPAFPPSGMLGEPRGEKMTFVGTTGLYWFSASLGYTNIDMSQNLIFSYSSGGWNLSSQNRYHALPVRCVKF
ncbi:MAG: hypothetical protein LBN29_13700 [Mediterranea sp.]|jgi:hypothetical protein|nr:hypothetical protein [Mediterranea sp.]